MKMEKIDAQTAVIHMPVTVQTEDSPLLKKLLMTLYDEGVKVIHVDFSVTDLMRKHCLGLLVLYQKKLTDRGGEVKFVNVTGARVKHLFKMLDLYRVINIEEDSQGSAGCS